MREDVKTCLEARTTFFGKYLAVPPALQPEVDSFLTRVTTLGESCADAADFEQRFTATGLSDTFNSLITRCTPQAYTMTREDKAHSRQVAREIFREDKDRILKEAGEDLLESVQMKAESDLNAARIEQMAEAGVLDDYTRATNIVEDVGILGRFFKKKLGKKK